MKGRPVALQIQRELVDGRRDIVGAAASEAVNKDLSEQILYCRAGVEAFLEDEGVSVDDPELRMFQCWMDRVTIESEGTVSNFSKEKKQVDKWLREQACQELGTHELWEQVDKLRIDLEGMASNHREEKERMEEAMRQMQEQARQERKQAEAAYKQQMNLNRRLQGSLDASPVCRGCSDSVMRSLRKCSLCRTRIVTKAQLLRIFKT